MNRDSHKDIDKDMGHEVIKNSQVSLSDNVEKDEFPNLNKKSKETEG